MTSGKAVLQSVCVTIWEISPGKKARVFTKKVVSKIEQF